MLKYLAAVFVLMSLAACASTATVTNLDSYGERFVRTALDLGQHDADYVDAYHGPEQWQHDAADAQRPLAEIRANAEAAAAALRATRMSRARDEQRRVHLARAFETLSFRTRMLMGESFSFDEESRGLYDAVAPRHDAAYFQAALDRLDIALPGTGDVATRYQRYRAQFVIAPERLDAVFRAAIDECARRTRARLTLPDDESFTVEYVTDKAWSGYNWFQGGARSRIQMNTDFPIHIDRAVDLACHEGYPGHHVYNSLLEQRLLNELGWIEFSVFPLFSPMGLIAEGSANYGITMAFPDEQRVAYERDTLFALAGLDDSRAEMYYAVQAVVEQLSYASNEVARRYIDGEIDRDDAANWLVRYALMSNEKAQQRVSFIDKYGAYVINYNLGRDMVAQWVERVGDNADDRWERFEALLSSPFLPSQLVP